MGKTLKKLFISEEPRYYLGKICLIIKRHRTTILRWEKRGLIPKARREKSSRWRYWTKEDLQKMINLTT